MKDNMKRAPFSTQIDLSKFNMKDFAKASDEEKRQQEVMGESTTFLKDGLKRLRKNPLAMGSIIVLVLLILVILRTSHGLCRRRHGGRAGDPYTSGRIDKRIQTDA